MPRHPKVKLWDKNKKMVEVSQHTIKQTLISKNPSVALEVDDILRNYVKSNTYLRIK
jgi:hypothetical protein